MISDRDSRSVATKLVADLGAGARAEVQRRCSEMLESQDPDGFANWKIVSFAVEEAIARPRLG
jgi:hypothetical protein